MKKKFDFNNIKHVSFNIFLLSQRLFKPIGSGMIEELVKKHFLTCPPDVFTVVRSVT